jgi:hypothetical protein
MDAECERRCMGAASLTGRKHAEAEQPVADEFNENFSGSVFVVMFDSVCSHCQSVSSNERASRPGRRVPPVPRSPQVESLSCSSGCAPSRSS